MVAEGGAGSALGKTNARKTRLDIDISVITEMSVKLTPTMQKFILHWGEMGWRWGINRSVAQVHALLMLSPKPLAADEICESLDVARSNVSTSLKELQGWGLIRVVHEFGDRREHFETLKDVWEMFLIILRARKKRELDPTLAALRECATEAEGLSPAAAKRLATLGEKVFRLV